MSRFPLANRISSLPPYPFAELDRLKNEALAKGADLIDVGIGDPDQPTPAHIVQKLQEAAKDPKNHRYPGYPGIQKFREAVQHYYQRKFSLSLDPNGEIIALIGSKEGIAHIPLAFVNPGDVVLVPNPGYPVYRVSTIFAGGTPHDMPLRRENGFLPDLSCIPAQVAKKARLMFLNYPNNPTAAVADAKFFQNVVEFAKQHDIIVCHDAAYLDLTFGDFSPPSFLQTRGAKDVGIEFHSLSKTYNMTGWRIGYAAGNADLISGLLKVKTNVDSGVFQAVQEAAVAALEGDQREVEQMRKIYTERRDILVGGLKSVGLDVTPPKATFYIWVLVPKQFSSAEFSAFLLKKGGIVATPGTAFGSFGEGYIRFTLCVPKERLQELVTRLKEIL